MPKVFEFKGYRFFFYSNEGNPLERCHIHVRKHTAVAKFWMEPHVSLATSWGMSSKELNMLEKLVEKKRDLIRKTWYEFFS